MGAGCGGSRAVASEAAAQMREAAGESQKRFEVAFRGGEVEAAPEAGVPNALAHGMLAAGTSPSCGPDWSHSLASKRADVTAHMASLEARDRGFDEEEAWLFSPREAAHSSPLVARHNRGEAPGRNLKNLEAAWLNKLADRFESLARAARKFDGAFVACQTNKAPILLDEVTGEGGLSGHGTFGKRKATGITRE